LRYALIPGALCLLFLLAAAPRGAPPPEQTRYVGAAACLACHGAGDSDGAFAVWTSSGHARAFLVLGTGIAEMVDPAARGFVDEGRGASIRREAARLGIDTGCLACHATAAGTPEDRRAATFHIEDGVQCEACHGPGETHAAWFSEGGDPTSGARPPASFLYTGGLDGCLACHREKASHGRPAGGVFRPESAWRAIAHGRTGP